VAVTGIGSSIAIAYFARMATLVALIADTHLPRGRRELPARAIELIRAADLVLHAGDFTTEAVLDELEAIGPPVRAVHGNMDSAGLRRRLPPELVADVGGVEIGMLHDAGPARNRLERLRQRFPQADVVVFGHSHLPLHERDGSFQIFNPGSPTERRRAPSHTIGLARVQAGLAELEHVVVG
jgi:putative phosphoesterase